MRVTNWPEEKIGDKEEFCKAVTEPALFPSLREPGNRWEAAKRVLESTRTAVQDETDRNRSESTPYSLVLSDIFDPEGREYFKRAKLTAEWNRPTLKPTLKMNEDGSWRSFATLELAMLEEASTKGIDESAWSTIPKKNKRRGQVFRDFGEW